MAERDELTDEVSFLEPGKQMMHGDWFNSEEKSICLVGGWGEHRNKQFSSNEVKMTERLKFEWSGTSTSKGTRQGWNWASWYVLNSPDSPPQLPTLKWSHLSHWQKTWVLVSREVELLGFCTWGTLLWVEVWLAIKSRFNKFIHII